MKKITDEQWIKILFAFVPVSLCLSIWCEAPHLFLITVTYCGILSKQQLEKKLEAEKENKDAIKRKIKIATAVMLLGCAGLAVNLFFIFRNF